jgi:hypothetical protein
MGLYNKIDLCQDDSRARSGVQQISLLVLALVITLSIQPAAIGAQSPTPPLESQSVVRLEHNRLQVALNQAPLAEVLQQVAHQSGFRLLMPATLDDRVSMAFNSLTVPEGLKRLIGQRNFVFLFTPTGQLEEVRLYAFPAYEFVPRVRAQGEETSTREATAFQERLASPSVDPDGEHTPQRADAVARASQQEAETALTTVLTLLTPQYEPSLRQQALEGLAFFGADVPVQPITEIALSDPEPTVGLQAADLLSQQAGSNPIAHQALRQVAEVARHTMVRMKALKLLQTLEKMPHYER